MHDDMADGIHETQGIGRVEGRHLLLAIGRSMGNSFGETHTENEEVRKLWKWVWMQPRAGWRSQAAGCPFINRYPIHIEPFPIVQSLFLFPIDGRSDPLELVSFYFI